MLIVVKTDRFQQCYNKGVEKINEGFLVEGKSSKRKSYISVNTLVLLNEYRSCLHYPGICREEVASITETKDSVYDERRRIGRCCGNRYPIWNASLTELQKSPGMFVLRQAELEKQENTIVISAGLCTRSFKAAELLYFEN